jgi:RNA-directed DNA polymerase
METELSKIGTTTREKPLLVRYADDFVILHQTRQGVEKARTIVETWLSGMNLHLNPQKTRITHTLNPTEDQEAGFDFLGHAIRQYRMGKTQTGKSRNGKPRGFKTLIKPSKEAINRHHRELREIVRTYQEAPQAALIGKLNPVITGWANYYRTVVAKAEYSRNDAQLYTKLWAWARRRHPNKTAGWVAQKYWTVDEGEGWKFATQEGHVLKRHKATSIIRHVKVRGTASPYDGNLLYWAQRLRDHPLLKSRVGSLLKVQRGKCAYCGLLLRDGDMMEVDHIIPRVLGGDDTMKNLQLMHRHCHDQKTARDGSLRLGWGTNDKDSLIEEPDAMKVACPVL